MSSYTRHNIACNTRIACDIDKGIAIMYEQGVVRDPIYKYIGSVIKQRRKQLDLKQYKLAARLGISRGSLANIETGRQSILVHQLYKFAEALDFAPNDLLPSVAANRPSQGNWAGVLPAGLKPQQQEQIARLLEGAHPEPAAHKKDRNGKPTKH